MDLRRYIKQYGAYSFKEVPFNKVDNAILCQITYVEYENVIKTNKDYSIKELSDLYFRKYSEEDIIKDKSFVAKSPFVLKDMAQYPRYRDIMMHHFVHSSSEKKRHQFAAMQFDIGDGTTYVSFRGTDDSILGWKEDLEMAYKKIPGYNLAKRYINFNCSSFKKYRVGGHSKGGALAVYAATHCFVFKRKNIIEVYSNDGPGIRNNFIKNKIDLIADRYIKIVPEDDIIGIIFDDNLNHHYVKTNKKGFLSHDMLSWQIEDGHFLEVKSLNSNSKKFRKNLNEYIYSMSKSEIINVCDSLSNFFDFIKINKVSDLSRMSASDIFKFIKEVNNIDSATKKVIGNIIGVFIESKLPDFSFSSDKMNVKR